MGTIYRIAPVGFESVVPEFDLETIEGMVAALRSPAVNMRSVGRAGLVEEGDAAVSAVEELLDDPNPFVRARVAWLLAAMGAEGIQVVSRLLEHEDPRFRLVAARALRRQDYNVGALAKRLAKDPAPALRAEAALWMRDVPFAKSRKVLLAVAAGFDGEDRTYLEAFEIGSMGKEADVYAEAVKEAGAPESARWPEAFAWIAWRLHPEQALEDLEARAAAGSLDLEARCRAMDAIAFMERREAAEAMIEIAAAADSPLAGGALWWLLNRATNTWENHDLMPVLVQRGLYDPSKVVLQEVLSPDPSAVPDTLPPVEEILKLEGDVARGKVAAQRCVMCHRIEGIGIEYGPTLTGWGRMQTREVIVTSIVNPSAADPVEVVKLWEGVAPGDTSEIGPEEMPPSNPKSKRARARLTNVSEPRIEFYPAPKETNTGAAVVVCPGGGYNILAFEHEGTMVVDWLNSIGVNGVLLKYRVPRREGREKHEAALQDAQRAFGIVRSKAKACGIDPE